MAPDTAAHPAGVCDCNAVWWELAVDETRTIRRYRVWQCRACKRLRHREDRMGVMTDQPVTDSLPATAAHRWVQRGTMGEDWWACECGAMSVDEVHPEQGGRLARQGTGQHSYEGKHRA